MMHKTGLQFLSDAQCVKINCETHETNGKKEVLIYKQTMMFFQCNFVEKLYYPVSSGFFSAVVCTVSKATGTRPLIPLCSS